MNSNHFETLSQATTALLKEGYSENFRAEKTHIVAGNSKKSYSPEELEIQATYRFEGMTNPGDDAIVFALKANDGTRGTLIMAYGYEHNQNTDLIKQIPGG
jgi:hypothetical protein